MKLNIKTLAAALTVGFTLVSCNDKFDENPAPANYPQALSLGAWTRQYVPEDGTSYTVNLTLNENGDTICDVTTYNPVNDMANVYEGGKVSYNKAIGMVTADYATSAEETPARITLAYSADRSYVIVNVYELSEGDNGESQLTEVEHFNAVASDTISVLGRWQMDDGTLVELKSNGQASVSGEDGDETGTYSFSGRSGQVTVGSKAYAMSLNDKGQMNISLNGGTPVYAAHVMTPLPNDWTEYAIGSYTPELFQGSFDVTLYHSNARSLYRLDPYGAGLGSSVVSTPTPIEFTWNKNTGAIRLKKKTGFVVGQNYYQDGQNYGLIRFDLKGDVTFDNDVFTFPFLYYCDAGSFSEDGATPFYETYRITDYVEQ